MSYYDRKSATLFDGTRVFRNGEDEKNEREVAELITAKYGCVIRPFGLLSPIDWYAEDKCGRCLGMLELKSHPYDSWTYPKVWLNFRKWAALMLSWTYTGVQPMFVVRFNDGVYWVPVFEIDARALKRGGCTRIVKSHTDIEPVIEVPIGQLRAIGQPGANR